MDKNILIAEMLYIVFVHYKGLGMKYRTGTLKKELPVSLAAVKLLYKNELSEDDIRHLYKMLDICSRYTSTDISGLDLDDLIGGTIDIKEPADKMCEIINTIISELGKFIRSKRIISFYFHSLHNLPLVYVSDNVNYLGWRLKRLRRDDAMEYCNEWLAKIL